MPNIPMLNGPGMVDHQRSTVPMSGAPGMDYKIDNGLANLGKSIVGSVQKIAEAKSNENMTMARLEAQQRYTDDRLNAAKARNLYREIQSSVEIQMAENPSMYAEFSDWTKASDMQYQEEVRQYLDKMTPEFRKQFEEEMSSVMLETGNKRKMLSIQASNTARYNEFEALWKDAALRGDYKECERILGEFSDILISRNEYEQKRIEFNRFAEYGRADRLLRAGDLKVLDDLKAVDEEGNYKNYTGLSMKDRASLIRYGEDLAADKRYNDNLLLQQRLMNGEIVTEEEIEEKFKDDNSTSGLKQKLDQLDMVRRFRLNRESAADKQKADSDYFNIINIDFSGDEVDAEQKYNELRDKIKNDYKGDGPGAEKLLNLLDAKFKAFKKIGKDIDEEVFSTFAFSMNKTEAEIELNDFMNVIEARYPDAEERKKFMGILNSRFNSHMQKVISNDEYRILTFDFSKGPANANYNAQKNYIVTKYANDPATIMRLTSQLDATFKKFQQPKQSYKDRFEYKFGMEYLKAHEESFLPATRFFQSSDEVAEDFNYRMIIVDFDEYMKSHPEATREDVMNWMNTTQKQINEINIKNIMNHWLSKKIKGR